MTRFSLFILMAISLQASISAGGDAAIGKRAALISEVASTLYGTTERRSLLDVILLRIEASSPAYLGFSSNRSGDSCTAAEERRRAEAKKRLVTKLAEAFRGELAKAETYSGFVGTQFETLSDEELQSLAALLHTPGGVKIVRALVDFDTEVSLAALRQFDPIRADALAAISESDILQRRRLHQATSDLITIAGALEASALPEDEVGSDPPRPLPGSFPAATTMQELTKLLAPKSTTRVPETDPWGQSYVYVVSQDRMHYRLVSGGSDRHIEVSSRQIDEMPRALGPSANPADDIVFQDGSFLVFPAGALQEVESPE